MVSVRTRVLLSAGLAVVAAGGVATGTAASGAGVSTPNLDVVAVESQKAGALGGLTLAARTDTEGVPVASMQIRSPGLRVKAFEVHRVAAEESCGGEHEGVLATAQPDTGGRALVRGLGIADRGSTAFAPGSQVQVFIDLKDLGSAPYSDQGRVRVRPAPHGSDALTLAAEADEGGCSGGSGWTLDSGWQPMLLVRVRTTE